MRLINYRIFSLYVFWLQLRVVTGILKMKEYALTFLRILSISQTIDYQNKLSLNILLYFSNELPNLVPHFPIAFQFLRL